MAHFDILEQRVDNTLFLGSIDIDAVDESHGISIYLTLSVYRRSILFDGDVARRKEPIYRSGRASSSTFRE